MSEISKYHLQQKLVAIAECVRDLTASDDLFRSGDFRHLYESPSQALRAAIEIYTDGDEPRLHKEILGYAMARLPESEFEWFVDRLANLAAEKRIPGQLLERAAFPPLNWNVHLRVNYERAEIRVLLERMASMDEVSSTITAYIEKEVLTGRAKEDILELREMGQVP